jgi:hypothetical protein
MSDSRRHDAAWPGAFSIVEVFAPLLREEEQSEAFHEVYRRLMALLEAYDIQSERAQRRLRPCKN